jgi:hypothetical protein
MQSVICHSKFSSIKKITCSVCTLSVVDRYGKHECASGEEKIACHGSASPVQVGSDELRRLEVEL